MRHKMIGAVLLCWMFANASEPTVEHHPVVVGASNEMGNIVRGTFQSENEVMDSFEDEWVDHFVAYIFQTITVNERAHLTGGLGGGFQFRKPEQNKRGSGFDKHQRKAFFIGPIAELGYDVGDLEKPFLKLGVGTFSYKYNPEARNLGEYLFRTRPYPTVLSTGGYSVVNSAAASLQGIKAFFIFGNFNIDLIFTTETSLAPLYDFSLGAVVQYSILGGFLDFGLGFNLRNLIPVKPERTTVEVDRNGYAKFNGEYLSTDVQVYERQKNHLETRINNHLANGDTLAAQLDSVSFKFYQAKFDTVDKYMRDSTLKASLGIKHFTPVGTILMGRATLDIQKLVPMEFFSSEDLKIFVEAAILGWDNYPVFYENRKDRIPVMVGLNVPTFRLLDVLSVQAEYFPSPYLNNTSGIGEDNRATPYFPSADEKAVSKVDYNDITKEDNIKWSIFMERKLFDGLKIRAQVARDHMQLTSSSLYFGPQFGPQEITTGKRDWYWMLQFAWGI